MPSPELWPRSFGTVGRPGWRRRLKPLASEGADTEITKMITRTLSKRVQKLETRRILTDIQPTVIQIQYVSADGSVTDGPRITVGGRSEDASTESS